MTISNKQYTPFFNTLLGALLLFSSGIAYALPPSFAKVFSPATIGPGNISTATFTINNSAEPAGVTGLAFSDTLPMGMVIATPAQLTSTCGTPTLNAPEGGNSISMSGGIVNPFSSCTLTVNVASASLGTHTNPVITLNSSAGASASLAVDLTVDAALPAFSKSFSPAPVNVGARTTLTFTVDNSLNPGLVGGLDFTDNLPLGMVVASPANASTDCVRSDTTLTAVAGSSVITLDANGIAFAGFEVLAAGLGAGLGPTCTVNVDVVATGAGSLANVTELLADFVSAGKAGATLTVSADELTFYKSFTDDPVAPGTTATLRYDILNTNRFNPVTAMAFSDDMGAMLAGTTVASVLSDTCGGVPAGTGVFSYSGGSMAADSACAIEVSLNIPGAAAEGAYPSTSSTISASSGTFSAASETLHVFAAPVISKTFTDDPVVAGGTVTLQYTISNPSTTDTMTDITFDDELTVFLGFPMQIATPLPIITDPCGVGSKVDMRHVGTDRESMFLELGSLPPSGSCTFSYVITIPTDFGGGSYTSTTDPISGVINATTRTGNQASDNLIVVSAPSFSKSFTDAPAAPGGTVTLEFNIAVSASAPGDVSNIAFSDDVAAMLTGTTVNSVVSDDCGGTPTGVGSGLFDYSGGTLSPGVGCTVSVLLDIDAAAIPGTYVNTSSTITADADDGTTATHMVSGGVANASLLVTGLTFSKEFIDDPSLPGDTVTLRYTIDNSASPVGQDATGTTFTESLTDVINGLTATNLPLADACGVGSSLIGISADTLLIFSGGNLTAGTSCSFDVTLAVPGAAADGSHDSVSSLLSATVGGNVISLPAAMNSLVVKSDYLTLSKSFTDDPLTIAGTGTLQFVLGVDAAAPGTVNNISFTDDLDATLSGLIFTGTSTSTDCTGFTLTPGGLVSVSGVSLAPGASCNIFVDLEVPGGAAPGDYTNSTSAVSGDIGGLAVSGIAASDTLNIRAVSLAKSFDGPRAAGDVVGLRFTLHNEDTASGIGNLTFSDDLNAALSGLVSITPTQNDVCGSGSQFSGTSVLSLTNGSLGANESCTIIVNVQIPTVTAGSYLNTTSQVFSNGLAVNGPASGSLIVVNSLPVNTVLPVISGTASVGSQLSSNNGTWTDANGDILTYSYQWKADDANIGANSNLYTLNTSEAHKSITLDVTANDGNGGIVSVTTVAVNVTNAVPVNNIIPVITGTAIVGNALNVDTGSWTDADSDTLTYSYQWQADNFDIAGAVNNSYILTAAEAHKSITVIVTAGDANGGDVSVTTGAVPMGNSLPVNAVSPVITGAAGIGSVLNVDTGTWTDADTDTLIYSYQWKADNVDIVGAVNNSYTLTASEANKSITVTVTADDANGGNVSVTTAAVVVGNTAPVNTVAPVITGTVVVGNVLNVDTGTWTDVDNDTLTYTYQWQADNIDIAGAVNNSYTLAATDAHKSITVIVAADDANGGSTSVTTGAVLVGNTAPVNTVVPVITGTTIVGGIVNVDTGSWTDADNDTLTYTYQWQADGNDIAGATSNAYNISQAEFTAVLTVVVTANDGNGSSVSVTSQGTVAIGASAGTPVVNAPADITVNATGLFTAVETGVGTVVDDVDGISLATANVPTHFSPGIHLVTWSSTDSDNNTGTDVQTVNVVPLISLSQDQMTVEGSMVSFSVILNGDAVAYPVTVAYSVSGTASTDGSDHNLVNGTATINNGAEASISFDIIDDGAGEGVENIIVTLSNPDNAVLGNSSMSIDFIEANIAPVASLSATQGGGNTFSVTNGGGVVTVTSSIVDVNANDSHSYDWSASDNALIDTDGVTETFSFDPLGLSPGFYSVRLNVNDGHLSDSVELTLNVQANAPVLSAIDDSDDDGIDDLSEGNGDTNGNGIADYLDGIAALNVLPSLGGNSQRYLLEANPGLTLGLGKAALENGNGQALIQLAEVKDTDLYDVSIAGVRSIGGSINLVIPQQQAIPADAFYGVLIDGIWQDFAEDANNQISSAEGDAGYCPPPGDAAYQAGLNEGDYCVQLLIENGGSNDSNASTNKVDSTGGVATDSDSDSGSGSMHPLWMLLALYALVRLQRRKH